MEPKLQLVEENNTKNNEPTLVIPPHSELSHVPSTLSPSTKAQASPKQSPSSEETNDGSGQKKRSISSPLENLTPIPHPLESYLKIPFSPFKNDEGKTLPIATNPKFLLETCGRIAKRRLTHSEVEIPQKKRANVLCVMVNCPKLLIEIGDIEDANQTLAAIMKSHGVRKLVKL